jgi:signal transduction histidine kinase
MYYIDTKFRSWMRKEVALGHIGPTLIVFTAFVGLTVWSSLSAKKDVEAQQNQILTQNNADSRQEIETRLRTYEDILRAGKGLYGASTEVTREEFQQFIKSFELEKRYSGIQNLGYIEVVPGKKLASHIESVREKGFPRYNVRPTGERDIYANIKYLVSTSSNNAERIKNIGFDVYTEETRRRAMHQARDSGEVVVTDIARPLAPQPGQPSEVLVMYMPIYSNNNFSPGSIQERRSALSGYVYSAFYAQNLVDDQHNDDSNYGFRVYDGAISEDALIYQSPDFEVIQASPNNKTLTETMSYKNQNWHIVGSVSPEVVSIQDRARPATTLWGGILFSIFVASFIYMLLLNKSRMTFAEEQREIQDAKDELLALASHQLRTPATGVKQYIGLLRDGYAGKLNKEQKNYVEKAYDNNERQLATINKMLFVARANANNLDLKMERFDIKVMLQSAIEDVKRSVKENKQKLTVDLPGKKTFIEADNKYLRMALENIIQNASKYTPEKGVISVSMKKVKQEIIIKVTDTGVGVDEEDFPLLFRKFSRIPNELTNKVSGSGIGLYLSKKVIKAHKGSIDFESETGEGTTFIIKLPIKQKS